MLIMRIYKRSCLIYDYCTFLACKELTQKTLLFLLNSKASEIF